MRKEELISLIGMPGSGKSAIGRMLAGHLGWDFVDMDDFVQEISGSSIPALFSQGEAEFRRWETEACRQLCRRRRTVIACGGGVVLDPENLILLKSGGAVVWIDRPLEHILRDIDIQTRPLLKDGPDRVIRLYEQRKDLYRQGADWRIANTGSMEDVVSRLLQYLKGSEPNEADGDQWTQPEYAGDQGALRLRKPDL